MYSQEVHNTRRVIFIEICVIIAGGLAVFSGSPVSAQEIQPSGMREIQTILREKFNRTPVQQKLESHIHLSGKVARGVLNAKDMPSLTNVAKLLEIDEQERVHVDIQGTVTAEVLAEIVAIGGTVESSLQEYGAIRAWIPLLEAEALAGRTDVTFIEPAAQGFPNSRFIAPGGRLSAVQRGRNAQRQLKHILLGLALSHASNAPQSGVPQSAPVDTNGEISEGADLVHGLGFTGAGVKIGVLSDGVISLATLQASGDLPATVTVLSGQAGTGDEGTAMLEIVYDLAPGAQLFFATANTSEAQFATNIQNLAAAGCNIIVDDFTFFDEGVFQDGVLARAVNSVTANGVLYFSSAANSGNLDSKTSGTWEGDFNGTGAAIPMINAQGKYTGKTVTVHAFDATHNYDSISSASSKGWPTSLKWSDPLGGACDDYDLFIMDSALSKVVESSTNSQTCTQDPFEQVSAPAAGNVIVVVLFSGSSRALHLDTERAQLATYGQSSGATFGHNAAASALTVAATHAQSTIFTSGNQAPESYSSDGPRKIFFNPDGSAITPGNFLFGTKGGTTISKVDFTAADCGQSAVSGFNPFCGTSAAAPTAAAIAALVLSANPSLTPSQVISTMKSTALSTQTGYNSRTVGAGVVMANLSVQTLSVTLTANPSSGAAPLSTNLTGAPSGSATGTLNYTFWYNCSDSGTSVSSVMAICGSIPIPTAGTCANNSIGYKCDGVTDDPKTIGYAYTSAGDYTAKIIAERGSAAPAENRTAISVAAPPAPSLLSPLNGAAFQSGTTSVNLQWSASPSATGYNVQVFTGSCGGTSFPGTNTGPGVTNWNVSGLSDGQTYYWQVQAVLSSTTSPYSNCSSFSILNPSSSVPVLLAPGSTSPPGPVMPTTTPTFQWNPVPGADAYALYVSQYPYGTGNLVYKNQVISGSASNFPIPAGNLNYGTSYRWNMQAHTSAGWSGVSGLLYFSVASSANSISGYVTLSASGLGGVTVTLSGSSGATATTSTSGYYSFSNLTLGGNYTVTPSLGGYTFTPTSTPFNNLSGNQTGNFTATASGVSYTVTTNPAGLQVVVDGIAYSVSQSFNWTPGSIHVITAESPQSGGVGKQYVYYSWSDGGSQTHTITIPSSSTTYVANFNTQYQLTTSVSPSGTGTISPDCSSGCWNNSGANVSLQATPNSGYTFSSWSGTSNGNSNPLLLTVNSPQSLTCTFIQGTPSYTPTVTTLPATSVYTTSAILNGSVNPNGTQTNAWFEYDTTPNITPSSPQTAQQNIGSDNSVHNIFAQLPSLTPGLTYFFRVAAISVGGTVVYSTPLSFLTASTNYTLQVGVQGTGSGTVLSSPSGINCPSTCQVSLASGSSVTLTATPSNGSTFGGWSGACNGTASCNLTMNSNQTVYATFALIGPPPAGGVVTFTPGTISTVAGNGTAGFLGDNGPATGAELNIPSGVAVDGAGNIYIADTANNRVRVINKQLTAITVVGVTIQPGAIATVAGNGTAGYSGDNGSAAQAELDQPSGVALDSAGDIFIADSSNVRVREVSTSGTITTVAGNGVAGSTGDGGAATNAEFYSPRGIGLDNTNNLYIADFSANRVRVVNRQSTGITVCGVTVQPGNIATIAGNGTAGYAGDGGPATQAELNGPSGVAADSVGNVYIADHYNNFIRKVKATTGTITTAAGSGTPPNNNYFWGDGGPASLAQLWLPGGVAVDAAGDVLISDTYNNRLREVSLSTGIITTIAGSGPLAHNNGYTGDGGPATNAEMYNPASAAEDAAGNIFIADAYNNVIRSVTAGAAPLTFAQTNVGQKSAAQDVTVSNVSIQNLIMSQITPSVGFDTNGADTTCTSTTTLSPGASCILGLRFAPTQVGHVTGSVTITDSAGNSPQSIPLNGTAVAPTATLSNLGLSFGIQGVGITSASQSVTVTNNGTAPLNFSNFVATGDFAVAVSGTTCSASSPLAVAANCILAVTFTPSGLGPRSSLLSITDNAAGSPQAVVLTGVGTAASLSPGSLTFTSQTVGIASTPQVITLTNLGASPMNIWQTAFLGTNASDFSKISACGNTLGAGVSCTISVTFTPGAAGTRTASLLVSDDGGGSPQAVSLTGTGLAAAAPAPLLQKTTSATGTSTTVSGTGTTIFSSSSGTGTGTGAARASASLSASSLSFGEQEVGTPSSPQSVVLTNTGGATLTIKKIEFSGSSRNDFTQTNDCGPSLATGTRCTLQITFTPHAPGARTVVISIVDDAQDGPHQVRVEGVGVRPEGGRNPVDNRR